MYKYDRYDTYVYKVTMTITMFNVKCTVRIKLTMHALFMLLYVTLKAETMQKLVKKINMTEH